MIKKPFIALAALFAAAVLAGCSQETAPADGSKAAPQAGQRPAIDIHDTSHLDRRYLFTIDDLAIRTATGRELRVTARAYCQTQAGDEHRTMDAYRAACRGIIGEKLMYAARSEDGISTFETFVAMDNKDIRPYNYFDEEMLLRALPKNYKHDLYTVTDVRDCATGAQTPRMDPYRAPPPGGWPNAEQRKALQNTAPQAGVFTGGTCSFK